MNRTYKFSQIIQVGQLDQKLSQVWRQESLVLSDQKHLNIVNMRNQSIKIYQFDILQASLINQAQSKITNVNQQPYSLKIRNRLKQIYFEDKHCFIILSHPFEIFMISPHQKQQLIKISLQSSQKQANINLKQLQDCLLHCSFPNLYIFGFARKASLISLNLLTFTFKQIDKSVQYGPEYRNFYIKCFNDDRIYITGGLDKNHKPFLQDNKLLWTFDLQKGFWFALQINQSGILEQLAKINQEEIEKQDKSMLINRFQGGKMLIIANSLKKIFLFELYQSKISEISSQRSQQFFPIDQIIYWKDKIFAKRQQQLREISIQKVINK